MINVVVFGGRICTDVDMRYTGSGTAVANFRVAANRTFKTQGQPDSDFVGIVAFGKTAEYVSAYLEKGARVVVTGRLQSRDWKTQDGQRRMTVEIVADRVQTLETKAETEARRAGLEDGHQDVESAPGGGTVPNATATQRGAAQGQGAASARSSTIPGVDLQVQDDEDPFGDQ